MNKNVVIGIVIVVLIVVIGVVAYFMLGNNDNQTDNTDLNDNGNVSENTDNSATDDNSGSVGSNVLVVYYSAQGHTKEVSERIADNLGADIFEITLADPYTDDDLNWTDDNSRVSREHNDESLRDVELTTTEVANWDSYDTILIGYPIWWGIAAWPVDTFVEANDFTGKTVIPFCTSASPGLGESGSLLADEAGTGNWLEGHRFSSNPSDSDVDAWTDSLK